MAERIPSALVADEVSRLACEYCGQPAVVRRTGDLCGTEGCEWFGKSVLVARMVEDGHGGLRLAGVPFPRPPRQCRTPPWAS